MLKEKLKNMDEEKKHKIVGMLLIAACFLVIGIFMRNVIFNIGDEEENAEEKEQISFTDTIDITDDKDADKETAKAVMGLKIEVPGAVKERINMERFTEAFEDYLIKNDFWSDTTLAKSDGIFIENYNDGSKVLTFKLDDTSDTIVEATIQSDGTFIFTHY